MKQIKIVSSGTPWTTKVFNHDGSEIWGITKIEITAGVHDELVRANIEFLCPELEVLADWENHPFKRWANRRTGKA